MPTINLQDVRVPPENWVGMNHSKVLTLYGQQEYWINNFGERLLLKEMDTDYLWNVIQFIRRSAPPNLFKASWWMARFVSNMGEQAQMEWERWDEEWARWEVFPWETPLARGIAAELASRVVNRSGLPHTWGCPYSEAELEALRMGR